MPRNLYLLTCAAALALTACNRERNAPKHESIPAVVETQWTDAAAKRTEALADAALKQDPVKGGLKYALPQMRVYDAQGQLVYSLDPTAGWKPQSIGATIDRAIASGHAIAGPSLKDTLADLQTSDGRPAITAVARQGTPLVFDYWASWCVPCKILEKALLQWQATKPRGSIQIVKAETDLMKLARRRGEKVYKMERGPDGELHKVEMR